jgi:alanyl-tRNA synthetase
MQFERDASGKMTPLPKPSVETGLGLERLTAILQGANNNFDTDLFRLIIARLENISGRKYVGGMAVEDAPFRVIADHARAAVMLMADGVTPSNEGRGYVLRRIIRRAVRYGRRLGIEAGKQALLSDGGVGEEVLASFQTVYGWSDAKVAEMWRPIMWQLQDEETRFAKTMTVGADRVGQAIEDLRRRGEKTLSGETVFRLYDTFGIPIDLIEEIASDEGLAVDRPGFERHLEKQRDVSRASAKFHASDDSVYEGLGLPHAHSEFRGYPELDFCKLSGAMVLGIAKNGAPATELLAGETGEVVTDRTVFYPQGGGQVADTGTWRWPGGEARVTDTQKPVPGLIAHRVTVDKGVLAIGTKVDMEVPEWVRRRTQANHTGTHLLHAALRKVLGESARQMGSLVAPDRLRFD